MSDLVHRGAGPIAVLLVAASFGCSGSNTDPPNAGMTTSGNGNGGSNDNGNGGSVASEATVATDPSAPVVGAFSVFMPPPDPAAGVTELPSFQGIVRDGPALELTLWSVLEEDADCQLLQPSVPSCDPACGSDAACVADDMCQPYPVPHSVGRVTLTGLELEDGQTQFALNALRPNFNYLPGASIRLASPPVAEGDPVQLTTEGGDYAAITLVALGIAPLEISNDGEAIAISSEESLSLQWSVPIAPESSRIEIELDISHHGGAKGKIECTTADDGSLTIDQALIAGLIELGFAGFPTIALMRKSSGFANIEAGQVALEIVSGIELPLSIPGLVSCADADDCNGQTCGADRTCQ